MLRNTKTDNRRMEFFKDVQLTVVTGVPGVEIPD